MLASRKNILNMKSTCATSVLKCSCASLEEEHLKHETTFAISILRCSCASLQEEHIEHEKYLCHFYAEVQLC